jgi:hypothetical protein
MVSLDYQKLPTNPYIAWTWVPAGGITDIEDAVITELNAGVNASNAISVDGTDFGTQSSNTSNDPSFGDASNVQTRGAAQYGGSVSMYYPKNYDDSSNELSVVYDALDHPRTPGFWAVRIDGDTRNSAAYAAGQYVSQYEVISDGEANELGGEEAQKRTVNFLSRGNLAVYTVTRSGAAALVVPATLTPTPGATGRIEATLNGRYFGGVEWSSSDPDVIEVAPGGFYRVTGVDTDTATITATHNGLSGSVSVTVTA